MLGSGCASWYAVSKHRIAKTSAKCGASMIGTLFAGYKIVEKLGGRSNGVVFKAWNPRTSEFVAIKILFRDLFINDEKTARFLREAQTAVILDHPNIASLYELGDQRGTQYIVMEYIEGKTFSKILENQPNGVSLKAFCGMIPPVVEALAYAHSQGVIHRDLKPDNLILNQLGAPVIVDFGLSKTFSEEETNGFVTSQGMVLGSPGYMSPEQVQAMSHDHRTDIFSLGVIMYELLNGSNPFLDDSPIKAMQKIINEDPMTLELIRPDLPNELINLISKCLEKELDNRYAHTHDLLVDLNEALAPFIS